MKQQLILNAMLAALTLLFTANLANAGDFSIGASAERTKVQVSNANANIDGDSSGIRVFGSYMFTKHFGIEAGYSSFGSPDDNSIPSNLEVESDRYDVYAVASYPLTEKFGVMGKAGFASSKTETELDDNDATETNHSATDLALSFGGQYDFTQRFGLRSEIGWIGSSSILSISGVFRF